MPGYASMRPRKLSNTATEAQYYNVGMRSNTSCGVERVDATVSRVVIQDLNLVMVLTKSPVPLIFTFSLKMFSTSTQTYEYRIDVVWTVLATSANQTDPHDSRATWRNTARIRWGNSCDYSWNQEIQASKRLTWLADPIFIDFMGI